ncbi:hypothetical protein ABTZ78_17220 [Streptomyces bauhiniae]|uniref:hypothetical protein n=1 Tax=Streptomyces bauhiniae TaxID=2340725 RepID=UPI00332DD84A
MTTTALAAGQYTTTTITTAGFALGLALLGTELWRWHKGGAKGGAASGPPGAGGGAARDPKALLPLGFGIVCGILMIACPAGLLGSLAGFLRWGGNSIGDLAMDWMTGAQSTQLGSAATPRINEYGSPVVTALFVVLWLLRKTFAKLVKGKWWKGVIVGCLLCVSTGTAALIAGHIIDGVNGLGAWAFGGFVHGNLA